MQSEHALGLKLQKTATPNARMGSETAHHGDCAGVQLGSERETTTCWTMLDVLTLCETWRISHPLIEDVGPKT